MRQDKSFALLLFIAILVFAAALASARFRFGEDLAAMWIGGGAFALALVGAFAIQLAVQWQSCPAEQTTPAIRDKWRKGMAG
jgi:hypothetical protein